MTIAEITTSVRTKALTYLSETGETLDAFPSSIVDFVIEYATAGCHFPTHFTEADIAGYLSKAVNSLAVACVEVYDKAGGEGQLSHNENGIDRTWESSWISPRLFQNLPNFCSTVK